MLHQTKVLLDQAVALERAGHRQSALELCEEVYRRSIADRDLSILIEAIIRIGYSYQDLEQAELAEEHLQLALVLANLNDMPALGGRALNGLAVLHQTYGRIEDSYQAYKAARQLASTAQDVLMTGSIDQNLGTLANIRGELTTAIEYYRSGLDCYEQIGYERGVAFVLNNLGMVYVDLDRFGEAGECLDRALQVSEEIGDVAIQGIVHTNRTERFLAVGELTNARFSCDEAFEIASRLGDSRLKAEALKFYGAIYREAGKPHLAEVHLKQSVMIAGEHGDVLTEAEAQRELALVLRAQGKNKEALSALNRSHLLFSQLKAQREQADVNQRIDQLEDDFLSLVRMWGESIEAKDRYTGGHCQRVADYACRIAHEAGLNPRDMVWFRMGAFLHDVGKVEVPEEVLNKPGKLSTEERAIMERHTIIGDEMLSSIEFPWDIRPMVRSHHERWDGGGYPDGLEGEAIPFTARILRIADVFDALTTNRSYRAPLSPEEAFRIMQDDSGSFDPELFTIFCGVFSELSASIKILGVGQAIGE